MYNSDPPSNTHLNAWQHWAFRVEQRLQEQQDLIEQLQQELQLLRQQENTREQQSAPTIHVDKIEYHFDQLKVDTLEGSLQIGLSTSNPEQLPMMIEDIMMKQQQENGAVNAPMFNGKQNPVNGPYPNSQAQAPYLGKYSSKPNSKMSEIQQKFQNSSLMPRDNEEQFHHDAPEKLNQQPPTNGSESQLHGSRSELAIQYIIDCCLEMLQNELNERFRGYIQRQGSLHHVEVDEGHNMLILEDIARQLPARVQHYMNDQLAKHNDASSEQLIQQVLSLTRGDIEGAIDQYIYQLSRTKEEQ